MPCGADGAQGIQLLLDRAVLSGGAHLADLTRSPATLAAVVPAVLAWLVTLGVGAQRYFPSRRRLAPAALAVALTGALSFAAVSLGVGRDAGELVTLGQLVPVAATSALVAGVVVFLLTGHRWRTAAPRHHREPPVYAHLADLLCRSPHHDGQPAAALATDQAGWTPQRVDHNTRSRPTGRTHEHSRGAA